MSTTTTGQAAAERTAAGDDAAVRMKDNKQEGIKNYKGFVAGVFSGIAKLTGEYLTHSQVPLQDSGMIDWTLLFLIHIPPFLQF
jgi:hypothetical protein